MVNSQGQLVYQKNLKAINAHDSREIKLGLNTFEQGIYFLQLMQDDEIITKRFVITGQ